MITCLLHTCSKGCFSFNWSTDTLSSPLLYSTKEQGKDRWNISLFWCLLVKTSGSRHGHLVSGLSGAGIQEQLGCGSGSGSLRWLPWDRQWLELASQGPGWLGVGWTACPHVASHVVCYVSTLGFHTTWRPQAPPLAALGSKPSRES